MSVFAWVMIPLGAGKVLVVFAVDLPGGVECRPKEVTVPEGLQGQLAGPQHGLSESGAAIRISVVFSAKIVSV
jgi:hypothetical protein